VRPKPQKAIAETASGQSAVVDSLRVRSVAAEQIASASIEISFEKAPPTQGKDPTTANYVDEKPCLPDKPQSGSDSALDRCHLDQGSNWHPFLGLLVVGKR
jgi:hypothetical protein